MTDLRIYGTTAYPRASADGQWIAARGTRSGELVTASWITAQIAEGNGYVVQYGTGTTPVALRTAFDADQPEINLDVPSGKVVIPVSFTVSVEATGAAGLDIHFIASPTAVGAGTSTTTTPLNLLVGSANVSSCSARITYSGNGTDPSTSARQIAHWSVNQDTDATGILPVFKWTAMDDDAPPMVIGAGSLNAYICNATSGTAFAILKYIELPDSAIS